MNWQKSLKGKVSLAEPLKMHTTFKIGGAAKVFIEPKDAQDLKTLLVSAQGKKLNFLIIGAGSNLLINDNGVKNPVIKLSNPSFKRIFLEGDTIVAGAGCSLNSLLKKAQGYSLSALEFLAGIPGTVGGALIMNAGIPGKNIGDLVEDITVMDYNGSVKKINKVKAAFEYRASGLSKYIVLSARLKLFRSNEEKIALAIKNYFIQRKVKQELTLPSAGCIFKNPPKDSAGRLIDLCGLKGRMIGGACVSVKHANFIVNTGEAKAKDVLALMEVIGQEVKNKFNIILEPEIKIWK